MKDRLRVLCVALERGNYELAAHALVYGMVKARIEMKDPILCHRGEPTGDEAILEENGCTGANLYPPQIATRIATPSARNDG